MSTNFNDKVSASLREMRELIDAIDAYFKQQMLSSAGTHCTLLHLEAQRLYTIATHQLTIESRK